MTHHPTITPIHDEEIEQLLRLFDQRGGVLKYFVFKCHPDADEVERHRLVATVSLRAAVKQTNEFWDKAYREDRDARLKARRNLDSTDFEKCYLSSPVWKVDAPAIERDVPKRLSLESFLGYDTLTSTESSYSFCPHDMSETGYQWAFFLPPHHLSGFAADFHDKPEGTVSTYFAEAGEENQKIYSAINAKLFGNMEKLTIYRWGTDCSEYFDDGKEWWGTFFWTVYSPQYDWYVGILGSTTD